MKRILVPTDFSDCSRHAMNFAANLARKAEGEIYLLHVFESGDIDMSSGAGGSWAATTEETMTVPYMIARLRLIKKQMHWFISEFPLKGLDIYDEVETGEPYIKINHAADKYEADIIVMGTHGA